jgi:hypothetical protein
MPQSVSICCSIDDYPVKDFAPSVLNDYEHDVLFFDHYLLVVANEDRDNSGSQVASTPNPKSAMNAEERDFKKTQSDTFHPDPATQNEQPIPLQQARPGDPVCSSPLETDFDPIRPCRNVTGGVSPPPPRRFYAFWWRNIARAAYGAERAARLQCARAAFAV